jgi:hypothetical protein
VVRCPAADTARRARPGGVVHFPGNVVRLPCRAAGPPASAAGPPRSGTCPLPSAAGPLASAAGPLASAAGPLASAAGPLASAAGPPWSGACLPPSAAGRPATAACLPRSAAGRLASAAYLPGSALRQPTIAPCCVACPHRVRRPVRGPDSAMRCVSPGALRRRLTSACLAAARRRPRSGTSRASPEPSGASLCAAGLRRRPPRGPSRCPVPHREEPTSPGPGQPPTHRTTAGWSQRSSSSCGHRRQSGRSSGCARRPGRRWPFHLAAPRVFQPRRPTSSICHNTLPNSIISRAQTSEEGRSTSSGATLFKACPAATYSPTRSPAQYHRR